MRTYAKNTSVARKRRHRRDDAGRQTEVAEAEAERRWLEQIERIGRDGEWNFGLCDSMPDLITLLPGWQDSGLRLHVNYLDGGYTRWYGSSVRHVGDVFIELQHAHYGASINGRKARVAPDGNCFFYAIWKVLDAHPDRAAVERVFQGQRPANGHAAMRYFRREISAHLGAHPALRYLVLLRDDNPRHEPDRPVSPGEPLKKRVRFAEPLEKHVRFAEPLTGAPASSRLPTHRHTANAGPNRVAIIAANASGSAPPPSSNEYARTLFHAGNQATEWMARTALTRFAYRQLSAFSPVFGAYASWAMSAYRLVNVLIRRDLLDGLMQALLLLPYWMLPPQTCLFTIARETKRYIDSTLGWADTDRISDDEGHLGDLFYMPVAIMALVTQYAYFRRRQVAFPESRPGKHLLGMITLLKHAAHGYALLETLVAGVPGHDLNADGDVRVSAAEIRIQKQEKAARMASAKLDRRGAIAASRGVHQAPRTSEPVRSAGNDHSVNVPLVAVTGIAGAVATRQLPWLLRPGPLVGAATALMTVVAGGVLSWLLIWREWAAHSAPLPPAAGRPVGGSSSLHQDVSSAHTGTLHSTGTPSPMFSTAAANASTDVTAIPTISTLPDANVTGDADVQPWLSAFFLDEEVDDFVITLSENDTRFLAASESIDPGGDAFSVEPMDLDVSAATPRDAVREVERALRGRRRRSVKEHVAAPSTAVTRQLDSWIRAYWPADGAFQPGPGDAMSVTSDDGWRSKNGSTYLYVGDGYWPFNKYVQFNASSAASAELVNHRTDQRFVVQRSSPGYRWGFSEADRRRLKLSPIRSVEEFHSLDPVAPGGEWIDSESTVQNLFNYKDYSPVVKNRLKTILQAVFREEIPLRYSTVLAQTQEALSIWFGEEYLKENSPYIEEIMLAKLEIQMRISHLKFYVNNITRKFIENSWNHYNLKVVPAILAEYSSAMSPVSIDAGVFEKALSASRENNEFVFSLNNFRGELGKVIARIEGLEIKNNELVQIIDIKKNKICILQSSLDVLHGMRHDPVHGDVISLIDLLQKTYQIDMARQEFSKKEKEKSANDIDLDTAKKEKIRLEKEIYEYQKNEKLEQEKLSIHWDGIEWARLGIESRLSKNEICQNVATCKHKNQIAHFYVLIKQTAVRLNIKNKKQGNYSPDDLADLQRLDIAKEYIHRSFSLTNTYLDLLSRLPIADIRKIPSYGDFRDILAAQKAAATFYKKMAGTPLVDLSDDAVLNAYYALVAEGEATEGSLLLMTSAIYRIMKNSGSVHDYRHGDAERAIQEFTYDKKSMSPVARIEKKPEGFVSIENLKSSKNFLTQREFTEQFMDYIEKKHGAYEADLISTSLAISSGLTPTQLYSSPDSFLKFKFFDIKSHSEVPGQLAFIKIKDSNWLMFSCLPGAMTAKLFKPEQMQENIYLKQIADNPYYNKKGGNRQWFDIYDYKFNMKFTDKKISKNHDHERWDDMNSRFIVPVFGKNSTLSNEASPLLLISYKSWVDQKTDDVLIKQLRDLGEKGLEEIAASLKIVLYKPSLWQALALAFVPFYSEIYHSQTDRNYSPNITQLIVDTITVTTVLGAMGYSAVNISRKMLGAIAQSVWDGRTAGLSGGALLRSVISQLPRTGMVASTQTAKILAWGLYDFLEPVPLKMAFGSVFAGLRKLPKVSSLADLVKDVPVPQWGKRGGIGNIDKNWRRNDISVAELNKGGRAFNREVYSRPVAGSSTMAESFEFFIKIDADFYEVRWDEYGKTWRVIDPDHLYQFNYAVPVRLDDKNCWVTHGDVSTVTGGPAARFAAVGETYSVSEIQSRPVNQILTTALDKAGRVLGDAKAVMSNDQYRKQVDQAREMFFGTQSQKSGADLLPAIESQRTFLKKMVPENDVLYRAGYSGANVENILEIAPPGAKGDDPLMTAYVDAWVDAASRNGQTAEEMADRVSLMMLRESHLHKNHGIADGNSVKISENSIDISSLVKRSPQGAPAVPNAEQMAFFETLVSYIKNYPDTFNKIIADLKIWKTQPDRPLMWTFPVRPSGEPLALSGTMLGALRHGSAMPLMGGGVLFGQLPAVPGIEFDFVRMDSIIGTIPSSPQKFSMKEMDDEDGKLHGFVYIWSGASITSKSKNGPVMGTWNGESSLGENVRIIDISNGMSGTVGIRVPLAEINEGKPVVISAGELSGCTMVYAVDHEHFYAYHAGQKPGDRTWSGSREGALSLYRAHLAMGGRKVPGIRVGSGKFLVGDDGRPLHGNNALVDIFSTYDESTINYLGKDGIGTESSKISNVKGNVNVFNYNEAISEPGASRVGAAYALLVKDGGRVKIVSYSEDMRIDVQGDAMRFNVLANSEYALKDQSSSRPPRKFEPLRMINQSVIPRGESVEKTKALLGLPLKYDPDMSFYKENPVGNNRNAMERLWALFSGRKNSEIVKSFDKGGMPAESAEKWEELKDLIGDRRVTVYVRAINYWGDGNSWAVGGNYFALLLNAGIAKFVLDPTAGQFAQFGVSSPLVEVEEDWVIKCQAAFGGSKMVIKYKDFASYDDALAFSPMYPVEARKFVEGAWLLGEADWYRQTDRAPASPAQQTPAPGALSSTLSRDGASVVLSWDAPVGVAGQWVLYRDEVRIAILAAGSTAYVDNHLSIAESGPRTLRYRLVADDVTLSLDVPIDYVQPGPLDVTVASEVMHFFSFDNAVPFAVDSDVSDWIQPAVSLQQFDRASDKTQARVIGRMARATAMQVASLNQSEDALNGMKLVDDISLLRQFSVGFWFKSDGVQQHSPIFGNKDWDSAWNPGFMIYQDSVGTIGFNVADGLTGAGWHTPFTPNAWVYVAMVLDAAARVATAYLADPIHGLQYKTLDLSGTNFDKIRGRHSTIGLNEDARGDYHSRSGSGFGTMIFDDIALWRKPLTKPQIQSLSESMRSLASLLVRPVAGSAPEKPARYHTVRQGEKLWDIAGIYYGDSSKWQIIYDANRAALRNANMGFVGQVLTIPEI